MLTNRLYLGYTQGMKTAISMPDYLFSQIEKTSKQMNLPRSTFIVKAVEEYFANHAKDSVTEKLNKVYSKTQQEKPSNIGILTIREATKNDEW